MMSPDKQHMIQTYKKHGILSDAELLQRSIQPMSVSGFDGVDNVVIWGAGPSFNTYSNQVQQYIDSHNSLVIGCNYNYPINSEFTMIIGKSVYRTSIRELTTRKIIITPWVFHNNKKIIGQRACADYQHYMLKTHCRNTSSAYWEEDIVMSGDESFMHWLGNCGFSALLASYFFTPKEVMIVGFDGPESCGITMYHFNDVVRRQKGNHANIVISKAKGVFLGRIINFLNSCGIQIAL